MLRFTALCLFAFALPLTTGCSWFEKDPESNSETHAKFIVATREMARLRVVAGEIRSKAIKQMQDGNDKAFDDSIEQLRENLVQQRNQAIDAEESASSRELRKAVRRDRENIEIEINNFDTRLRSFRENHEWGTWLKATTN